MSSFDDNLKVINTKKKGLGVITKVDVPKGTVIFEFRGTVMPENKIPTNADLEYYLQIGKNLFLSASGGIDDIINHSCNPNCGVIIVGNRAFLISLYVIKANTEITFDYSTTSTDTPATWSLKCNCGEYTCRKIISGYNTLPTELQKYYQSLNIIPNYVKGT